VNKLGSAFSCYSRDSQNYYSSRGGNASSSREDTDSPGSMELEIGSDEALTNTHVRVPDKTISSMSKGKTCLKCCKAQSIADGLSNIIEDDFFALVASKAYRNRERQSKQQFDGWQLPPSWSRALGSATVDNFCAEACEIIDALTKLPVTEIKDGCLSRVIYVGKENECHDRPTLLEVIVASGAASIVEAIFNNVGEGIEWVPHDLLVKLDRLVGKNPEEFAEIIEIIRSYA